MKVLLDSNVFCRDFKMSGTDFRLLREGIALIPANLMVPEVVVDEVVNKYRETLEKAHRDAQKAHKTLDRLLFEPKITTVKPIDLDHIVSKYRAWFLSTLQDMGAEILPYPQTPHKKIVERDLRRISPFKLNGAGYRDCLIWENLKIACRSGFDKVAFVTANKSDFGKGPLVAEDLLKELTIPDRLELFQELKLLIRKHILPKFDFADDIKSKLQSSSSSTLDVLGWMRDNLVEILREEEELGPYIGLPSHIRVWTSGITEFKEMSVEEVRRLPEGEVLVRINTNLEVQVSVDIDWDDYVHYQEIRDWVGGESEYFKWMSSDTVEQLDLGLNLILSGDGEKLIDSEIGSIDGLYASATMGSF